MVAAILEEISLQSNYLEDTEIDTIYFGGGTPSLLSSAQLEQLLTKIHAVFRVNSTPEITLEANPDDLSIDKLKSLKLLGINRLSIGIQSFYASHLTYLNRIHTSKEAMECVANARNEGFENISIDLIYGIPSDSHEIWLNDIKTAINLNVEHISAYCLSIEEKTVFGNWLKNGKIKLVEDEFAAQQFEHMVQQLGIANYEQYEISNFAKVGKYSKHNSSYWRQSSYLGVGPGAHSFNGDFRQYNISNNPKYIKSIQEGDVPYTVDALTNNDVINEHILISLRTMWGLNTNLLKNNYGYDLLEKKAAYVQQLTENKLATLHNATIQLTTKGKLLADHISTELFIE